MTNYFAIMMVQIFVYGVSNAALNMNYLNDSDELHDSLDYISMGESKEVSVQDGGNLINYFYDFMQKFKIGPLFEKFMEQSLTHNIQFRQMAVFGHLDCHRISSEMKSSASLFLEKTQVSADIKSKLDGCLNVFCPDFDNLSETEQMVLYYYRLIEALDQASQKGLLIICW